MKRKFSDQFFEKIKKEFKIVDNRVIRTTIKRGIRNGKYFKEETTSYGYMSKDGYLMFRVNSNLVAVHQIAYYLYHGKWPELTIDHKNRIRTDNSKDNLVEATSSEQNSNRTSWKGRDKSLKSRLKNFEPE